MLREMPEVDRRVELFSYDKKPGIQAIATTAPDRPPVLRRIRVNSKSEPTDRLDQYIEMCNAKPLVPTWVFRAHDKQIVA